MSERECVITLEEWLELRGKPTKFEMEMLITELSRRVIALEKEVKRLKKASAK